MKNELRKLRLQVEEIQRQLNSILDQIDALEKIDTQDQSVESMNAFSKVIDLSSKLYTIPDFPKGRTIHMAIAVALDRKNNSCKFADRLEWPTVDDLLKLSEPELLMGHSMGKGRVKMITDWMKSYGLDFYYMKKE